MRGQKVILDFDLAAVYGVPTKRLNEQVRRNARRFPPDLVFRLTVAEATKWRRSRSQIATLKRGGNIKYPPFAFTEHGAIMAANTGLRKGSPDQGEFASISGNGLRIED